MHLFNRTTHILPLAFWVMLLALPGPGFCQTPSNQNIAGQAAQHVETAIQVQQASHKDRTKWEQEKTDLVFEYEQLVLKQQRLEQENTTLRAQQANQQNLNQSLIRQKTESIRIQKELAPFLNTVQARLETLVKNDPPFLKQERSTRLTLLDTVLKNPEITMAEKYRKIMEALFIEAEYGSTIEVYQDQIRVESLGQEDRLSNIFRLGRVSLFFLSLDQTVCGVFNPGTSKWQVLPDTLLPAIRSAVEIGSKRRPAELLTLPLGRLSQKGGDR